jgi:hypothetical protein
MHARRADAQRLILPLSHLANACGVAHSHTRRACGMFDSIAPQEHLKNEFPYFASCEKANAVVRLSFFVYVYIYKPLVYLH